MEHTPLHREFGGKRGLSDPSLCLRNKYLDRLLGHGNMYVVRPPLDEVLILHQSDRSPPAVHRFLGVHDASFRVARPQLRKPLRRFATALVVARGLIEEHQRLDDFRVARGVSVQPVQQFLGFVIFAAANQVPGLNKPLGQLTGKLGWPDQAILAFALFPPQLFPLFVPCVLVLAAHAKLLPWCPRLLTRLVY